MVGRVRSNERGQSHVESERFLGADNVLFCVRKSQQTLLQPCNLYGFPSAPRTARQGFLANEQRQSLPARWLIPGALPRAREAIP
jgi:hypothetical protein